MTRLSFCLILVLILCCLKFDSFAQKPNVKFGKISLEELKMQAYPKDTFAGAVVLYSKGSFDGNSYKFTHFTRIKILKPSELGRANLVFHTPNKGDVSGYTYNLSADGEIIEERLKNSSIFIEEIFDNYYVLKVAMSSVKVGSVIDIKYTHYGLPYEWVFQQNIPVVWSELKIDHNPNDFSFTKNPFGFEPLHINESDYWVAKDMPAIKPEPFISSLENYRTKFEFNITFVSLWNQYVFIAHDWEAVNNTLDKNDRFGGQLRTGAFLNHIADSIKNTGGTDREKIAMALTHIQKKMRWNGWTNLMASGQLSHNYKKTWQGNSADLNLSLIILLKKMGYHAYPVALSTRDNGFLSPVFPSLTKMNDVIAYVKLGEEEIFLDASDKLVPPGLLPLRCLNLQGRLIDPVLSNWVSLTPRHKFKKKTFTRISISDRNSVEYRVGITHEEYAALEQRVNLDDHHYLESRKMALESFYNVLISQHTIIGKETLEKPVVEEFVMHQDLEGMGDFILINPLVGQRYTQNPLFSNERKLPVDFIHPMSESYVSYLDIPEGYQVESLPESVYITLPEGAGKLVYKVGQVNNTIQLSCTFDLNQHVFAPDRYKELKQFLDLYINQTTSPIVLKRDVIEAGVLNNKPVK